MGSMRGEGGAGGGGGGGLADLVDDTTPQLGGDLDVNGHNVGGVTPTELGHLSGVTSAIQTQLDAKVDESTLGQADGVATLDGTGKLPTAQLPAAALGHVSYQGVWNAATNSPAIPAASAATNMGWYYRVGTAGGTTIDGISDWKVGDWIVSNGSIWEKVDNTDQVTSVNGRQGDVTTSASDINDSTTAGRDLLTAADVATQRTALELGDMATQSAGAVAITGGTISNAAIDGGTIGATTPVQAQARRPTNAQTGTTYTFVIGDAGKLVTFNNAGSQTATVPPNADVAFPVNTEIDLASLGAGTVTVAPGSGVTIRSLDGNLALAGQYAGATLKKLATNEWLLVGGLA